MRLCAGRRLPLTFPNPQTLALTGAQIQQRRPPAVVRRDGRPEPPAARRCSNGCLIPASICGDHRAAVPASRSRDRDGASAGRTRDVPARCSGARGGAAAGRARGGAAVPARPSRVLAFWVAPQHSVPLAAPAPPTGCFRDDPAAGRTRDGSPSAAFCACDGARLRARGTDARSSGGHGHDGPDAPANPGHGRTAAVASYGATSFIAHGPYVDDGDAASSSWSYDGTTTSATRPSTCNAAAAAAAAAAASTGRPDDEGPATSAAWPSTHDAAAAASGWPGYDGTATSAARPPVMQQQPSQTDQMMMTQPQLSTLPCKHQRLDQYDMPYGQHITGHQQEMAVAVMGPSYGLYLNNELSSFGAHEPSLPPDASSTLYVEGLPSNCTRWEVAHIFHQYMGFREVRLVNKGSSRHVMCFVDFATPGQAFLVMQTLQGYKFDQQDHRSPNLQL
uniref:RRM domain-containing protein n=1 Tax=Arundo donax TaxID=35708 RepID=A0A0A9HFX3_ARUDO